MAPAFYPFERMLWGHIFRHEAMGRMDVENAEDWGFSDILKAEEHQRWLRFPDLRECEAADEEEDEEEAADEEEEVEEEPDLEEEDTEEEDEHE